MQTLLTNVQYDRWANLRLVEAVCELDEHAFKAALSGSFPSLHETLVHILWAEELWLERWQGGSFRAALEPTAFPTPGSLRDRLQEVHERQLEFLSGLPASAADRVITYVNFQRKSWSYPLRHMVQHLVVHSAFHRGQGASFLRQLGTAPPHTDFLVFVDTEGQIVA